MKTIHKTTVLVLCLFSALLGFSAVKEQQESNQKPWALVTGASSGLGREFATQLAAQGYNLVVVARRTALLESLKTQLEAEHNNQTICITADLTEEGKPQQVFADATNGRNIQVLINNAGTGYYKPFLEQDLAQHVETLKLNVLCTTILSYLFGKHVQAHDLPSYLGNVASLTAYHTLPDYGVYCGSKAAVKKVSNALSFEMKRERSNLSVTSFNFGGVYTELMGKSNLTITKSGEANMMYPKETVEIALKDLFARKTNSIPGARNHIAAFSTRFMPENLAMKVADSTMKATVHQATDSPQEATKQ